METLSVALNPAVLAHSHSAHLIHLLIVVRTVKCALAGAIIQLFVRLSQSHLLFYFLLHDARLLVVNGLVYFGQWLLFLFNFL